jgi:hypothetical protein
MLNYLINLLTNALNEFLFKLAMLIPMGPYSQSERVRNEEPLNELESNPRRKSMGEQLDEYLYANLKKHYFDTPYTLDGEFYQIIQILRTTKLRQCRGHYYNNRKFCALGAIMHEKYGWNGNDDFGFDLLRQQLVTILGNDMVLSKMEELNDSYGKSFSEIADWLETIYLEKWG